jgi:hypothetical protein
LTGKKIDLGFSDTTRNVDAGKIEYGPTLDPSALCIIGKGTLASNRSVKLYDNVNVTGSLTTGGVLTTGGALSVTGAISTTSAISATGTISASSASINGNLTVNGNLKSDSLIGAYVIDADNTFPIICSIKNFDLIFFFDNKDDMYIVMPGYRIVIYDSINYGGTFWEYNNINGTMPLYYGFIRNATHEIVTNVDTLRSKVNQGSSCKLYYGTTEITQVRISS